MVNHPIKLAIAASFLDAFSKLPKSIQGKTTSLSTYAKLIVYSVPKSLKIFSTYCTKFSQLK